MSTATPHAAMPPSPITLDGRWCRLEPLAPVHAPDLWRAATPDRFTWLFNEMPASEAELLAWVDGTAGASDPMYFAVIDKATGRVEGRQALMNIVPAHGVIEVGGVYWGESIARTRVATEALYLTARHVFDDLGYRRFEWKCNDRNEPSKRAALRFGFAFEGVFRQHMIIKGASRDTAWFSMVDGDWPRLRAGYQRWLDPANFNADGKQIDRLTFE